MATSDQEMACRELVELVTEYLEGTLSPQARDRFLFHLSRCPGCVEYIEQMRLTTRLLRRLTESTLPAEVRAGLLEAFRDWSDPRR